MGLTLNENFLLYLYSPAGIKIRRESTTSGQVGPKLGESIRIVHIVIVENVLVLARGGVRYGCVYLVNCVSFVRLHFHAPVYQGRNIETISFIGLGGVLIARMLLQIVLRREEWAQAAKLQAALVSRHCRQFVYRHKLFSEPLQVLAVALLNAPRHALRVHGNGFLPQSLRKLLDRGVFPASQENDRIHIAHDGFGIVFIQGF